MKRHARASLPLYAHRPLNAEATRRDWVMAIGLADGLTWDSAPSDDAPRLRLVAALRNLRSENFPIEAASARSMAAAFLLLARTFVEPATAPEARTACAPFLRAGAEALDGLLNALRDAEAQAWRGRTGERED